MPFRYITPPNDDVVIGLRAGTVMPWEIAAREWPTAASARAPFLAMRVDAPLAAADKQAIKFSLALFELDNGVNVVVLRLQIGTVQIHWLAHPEDPGLWDLLDAWKHAQQAAFALDLGDRYIALVVEYGPHDDVLRSRFQRSPDFDVESFVDAALALAMTGAIAETATSDIRSVCTLKHIQVATLSTAAVETVMRRENVARHP